MDVLNTGFYSQLIREVKCQERFLCKGQVSLLFFNFQFVLAQPRTALLFLTLQIFEHSIEAGKPDEIFNEMASKDSITIIAESLKRQVNRTAKNVK